MINHKTKNYSATHFDLDRLTYSYSVYDTSSWTILKQHIKKPFGRPIWLGSGKHSGWDSAIFNDIRLPRWSDELPHLYYLRIQATNLLTEQIEIFAQKIGIRALHLKGDVLYSNSKPVSLKAIVLDLDAQTLENLAKNKLTELIIKLKQHHINTIIPPAILTNTTIYQVCDIYGMYVIQGLTSGVEQNKAAAVLPKNSVSYKVVSTIHLLKNYPSLLGWDTRHFSDPAQKSYRRYYPAH